jgi:hypothetical protein
MTTLYPNIPNELCTLVQWFIDFKIHREKYKEVMSEIRLSLIGGDWKIWDAFRRLEERSNRIDSMIKSIEERIKLSESIIGNL